MLTKHWQAMPTNNNQTYIFIPAKLSEYNRLNELTCRHCVASNWRAKSWIDADAARACKRSLAGGRLPARAASGPIFRMFVSKTTAVRLHPRMRPGAQ